MTILNSIVSYDDIGQGRFVKEINRKPVYYFRDGFWQPITNRLDRTNDSNFPVGVSELFDFKIKDKISGNSPLIHIGKGDEMIQYTPLDTNNVDGIVSGNSILYPEAWANADLKITVGGHIINKDILLKAGHPLSFSFRVDNKTGLDYDLVGDEFFILKPYLYKSKYDIVGLDWVKSTQGGKMILTATLPKGNWEGWTLDPTYISQPDPTAGADTQMYSVSTTTNYGTSQTLNVIDGDDTYDAWKYSSLIKFDLSSISAGSTINSASLYLRCPTVTHSFSTQIYRTIRDWVEAQATWDIYKTANNWGTAGCRNATTDYNNSALATATLAVGDNNIALSTSLIQTMIPSGSFTNNGFVLHSFTTVGGFDDIPVCQFYSSDYTTNTAYRPKLTIVYTESGGSTVKPAYYYAQQ